MRKQTKIKLIYARYILPPILMVLTVFAMAIPSYRYIYNGTLQEARSALNLIFDSFDTARRALLSGEIKDETQLLFSRNVLLWLAILSLTFVIAVASAVYSASTAIKYFNADDESAEKSRTLFITFFPNRTFLCIVESFFISLALFPYMLPMFYESIWSDSVSLFLSAPDGLIFGGVSVIAIAALSIMCAPMERALEIDIFKKRKDFEQEEEEEDISPNDEDPSMSYENKKERNKEIRRILLGGADENITDTEEEEND